MDAVRKNDDRKGGRFRRRVLLTLVSTFVALALAEIGLRVVAALTNRTRGIDYHEEFGWKMVPNAEKVGFLWGGDAVTRINSSGWRDDEFIAEPDPMRQRIAVVGDSFTFGVGVDHGDRFTEQMEVHGLDVLNFGVNSSGTDQQLRYLEEEALALRPSIVVMVTFLGNDLEDIRFERKRSWPKPYYELEAGALNLVRPTPDVSLYLRTHSYVAELVFQVIDNYVDRDRIASPWESRDPVPLYLALAARARDVAEAAKAKFLVALVHPSQPTGRENEVRDGLRGAAVETLDTFALFHGRGADLHLPDGHWNARGHAVFAAALVERLRTSGWIPR